MKGIYPAHFGNLKQLQSHYYSYYFNYLFYFHFEGYRYFFSICIRYYNNRLVILSFSSFRIKLYQNLALITGHHRCFGKGRNRAATGGNSIRNQQRITAGIGKFIGMAYNFALFYGTEIKFILFKSNRG